MITESKEVIDDAVNSSMMYSLEGCDLVDSKAAGNIVLDAIFLYS